MKEFLIAIAILLVLVAAFSTIESRVEFDYPFGNWAVPSKTGTPYPGEGEPGDGKSADANTFSFGTSEQTPAADTQSQEYNPITVEVVKTESESNRWRNLEPFNCPLYYVVAVLACVLIVLLIAWIVLAASKR